MKRIFTFLFILLFMAATPAFALDFDFSGTFQNDDDSVLLDFSVGETSDITIFSSSWGDGEDPDGYMANGGFDPILAVWDSTGSLLNEQDDGGVVGSTFSNGVEYTHGTWDSYFELTLDGGDYTASITQYSNFRNSNDLSDGFQHDGNPNFTFDEGYGDQSKFNGVWSQEDPRNGNWAFHILDVDEASQQDPTAPVPEPTTWMLLAMGLFGIAVLCRKKMVQRC